MEMIRYIFVYLLSILAFHYGFDPYELFLYIGKMQSGKIQLDSNLSNLNICGAKNGTDTDMIDAF